MEDMGYGVFVQKNPGIITLFGATKSFEAEVFFAVDEGVCGGRLRTNSRLMTA